MYTGSYKQQIHVLNSENEHRTYTRPENKSECTIYNAREEKLIHHT